MKLNRKNKLLVVGSLASLYFCYAFAFSNTLEYYRVYSSQKEILDNSIGNADDIRQLMVKEKMLNAALEQYSLPSGASFQNELLKEISRLGSLNELKITSFREPHYIVEKDVATRSYIFSLEGSFNGILLLVNQLENSPALGTIKNVSFIKKRNYKTNTDYLMAEIILQKSETLKNKN